MGAAALSALLLASPVRAQVAGAPASVLAPSAPTPRAHDAVPRPTPREPRAVPPPAEVAAQIDAFFKALKASEVRQAYQGLLAGTRLISRDEDLTAFITKTQQATNLYGQMTDYEVYDTRNIGSRLLVATYLTALPIAPLRWRFIYYKADTKWTLINLVFDDSMADLLE